MSNSNEHEVEKVPKEQSREVEEYKPTIDDYLNKGLKVAGFLYLVVGSIWCINDLRK